MPFKSDKQRKWMHANEPEMAKKWEKEEALKEKLRKVIRQEIKSINESDLGLTYKKGKTVKVTHKKSGKELVIIDKPNVKREYEKIGYFAEGKINEGFEKYHLGGLLDSKLKKRLERAIKLWSGKVDAVGDDYIKFRMSSPDVSRFPALLKKLDHNKNVWIGDKRKNNIWDRRQKINKLEATTSVSVPGYLSPQAFQKSTQNAIDVDDEDDEKNESINEAYKVDIDKLLQNPKIKKLMKRLNIRKSQSQQGAIQLLNYFATNPHALAAFKKIAVGESMAAPFRRRKSRGLGRPMKVGLNESSWSQPLGWSSPEAKVHVDKDITKMSKHLGKTSHDIIKIMMSGVKGGKYDAMDLQRGMKEGDARRTHYGEMDFIQELWHKVRDGFRRYSKRGKLR